MASKYLPAIFLALATLILDLGAAGFAGTTPVITVLSPANQSQVSSPVRYVASASSPQCAKGISAMRIYITARNTAFSVTSSSIDTLLILGPGVHRTVVEASDHCGGVSKAEVSITVATQRSEPAPLH